MSAPATSPILDEDGFAHFSAVKNLANRAVLSLEVDSEKRRLFCHTSITKLLTSKIWEAAKEPSAALHVSAEKLRNNCQPVNPAALAAELGISVATMYRRFGRQAVRRAWQSFADYALTRREFQIVAK